MWTKGKKEKKRKTPKFQLLSNPFRAGRTDPLPVRDV